MSAYLEVVRQQRRRMSITYEITKQISDAEFRGGHVNNRITAIVRFAVFDLRNLFAA